MTPQLKNQKRQFRVILFIVFIGFVGISMPYLIFPPLFLNVEYSFLPSSWGYSSRALFLGITLAVYPIGQFIGAPILGALSDDYGRKYLLSGSLIIASICNLFAGIAIATQQLLLLIISRFIAGLMEGNIAIARAVCSDFTALSKHKTFGKINAVASIGYLFGPIMGAMMTNKNFFESLTTATPFYFICMLFLLLSALSIFTLKNSAAIPTAKMRTLWQRFNFISRLSAFFSDRALKTLLITSTCFTLAVDIFYQFGPVYLTAKWMLSPTQLILYNGVLSISLAVGNGWLPHLVASRTSKLPSIIVALGGFSLLLLSIVFSNTSLLMLTSFSFSGLVIGLAGTLLTVQISDCASDKIQGEVMGTQLSLRVLGDGIICLFGSVLLVISPKIILIIAAIISLATMVYFKSKQRIHAH